MTRELVLGIESSCDETAAAIVDASLSAESPRALADVVASQVALHAPHGGVVPELASRQHLRDVAPVVKEALARSGASLADLAGIAVTQGPGLVGALLVGVSFAKSLAMARGLPLVGVHHLAGHVRAAFLLGADPTTEEIDAAREPDDPYLALVVSGGHTSLYRVVRDGFARHHEELARTLDDAAGEAYDKCGKLLGLGYPAGPLIDRLASAHRANGGEAFDFPRARIKVDGGRGVTKRAFSFSGLKTSVRHAVEERGLRPVAPGEDPASRADLLPLLAGFQEAVVDMLVRSTLHVARAEGLRHVVAVGGVSANSRLRERLRDECALAGASVRIPSPRWSTDNAAMIAAAGALALRAGRRDDLTLRADPALILASAEVA
jgi:N6-L-threonylcarbamoyladenine synthase